MGWKFESHVMFILGYEVEEDAVREWVKEQDDLIPKEKKLRLEKEEELHLDNVQDYMPEGLYFVWTKTKKDSERSGYKIRCYVSLTNKKSADMDEISWHRKYKGEMCEKLAGKLQGGKLFAGAVVQHVYE